LRFFVVEEELVVDVVVEGVVDEEGVEEQRDSEDGVVEGS
jgi:hypothetical protein